MKNLHKRTAVILFNLGAPDKLASVKPFLFNLFNDKAIISLPQPLRFLLAKFISSRREKKSQAIYAKLGGGSPLLATTLAQAHALEKELSFFGNFKVFTVMRYWHPFADEVIEEIKKYDPSQMILLPLYPQFSTSTSESSINEFIKKSPEIPAKIICCYPVEPEFIKSHSLLIKQTLMKSYDGDLQKFRFLFSAHGLPQKLIDAGDPYAFHVEETSKKIVKNLAEIFATDEEKIDYQVCYQSKVGPLRWTSPSTDYEIKRVALDKKIPVIIPVSFVSDHSETLVELDIDYKKLAQDLGVENFLRVPALNLEGHFIKALTEICKNAESKDSIVFSARSEKRFCPNSMKLCPNPNPCQA